VDQNEAAFLYLLRDRDEGRYFNQADSARLDSDKRQNLPGSYRRNWLSVERSLHIFLTTGS